MWNADKIKETIDSDKIVVFAKGTRMQPMCGFSAKALDILSSYGKPFTVVNIFDDPEIRPALVSFSQWPTTPQLFIEGEFIGGSDIMLEMFESGDLQKKLQAAGVGG